MSEEPKVDLEVEEKEEVIELTEPEKLYNERIFSYAIVRMPSPTLANGISHSALGRPDYAMFLQQHLSYTAVLRALGLKIIKLPSLPEYPDAQFVEDVAVVTPEIAVITRPGAAQRRGETEHISEAFADLRPVATIEEPGTLDGGDVLRIRQKLYVGLSKRTNKEGAQQLADILEPFGYTVHTLPVKKGLHLKSEVNYVGRDTLLITEPWAKRRLFSKYEKIIVAPEDAYSANTLLVNGRLLTPAGFPKTVTKLREAGFEVLELVLTEPQKLDGGLSCLSIRF